MLRFILGLLIPREGKFFDIFDLHARCMVDASNELVALIANLGSIEQRKKTIHKHERDADKLEHQTIELLHNTFITPLDRDQIHKLISSMDDVIDLIKDLAVTIFLYDVRSLPKEAIQLSCLCQRACKHIASVIGMLPDLKNAKNILDLCKEIDLLESEADGAMRTAISVLFREEEDVKTLIKHKAVLELLETITDRCEDVANIVQGIVLENI